jgi:DNA-binding MarR family transcriptional regulator
MESIGQAETNATASVPDPLALFTTLARTSLFLEALQADCLSPHQLSFSEYSVLRLLQRAPRRQLSPTLLAERVVCTTGAMTKLVDRLERSGKVVRERDPKDRRGILVKLTREGAQSATAASRSYRAGRERILAQLDPADAGRIQSDLHRLLAVMEDDRKDT